MTIRMSTANDPVRRPRRTEPLRAVQPRALATQNALLAAGRRLLQDRTLAETSIADIAAESGMSVGSFYGRFRDKTSYFAVLQERTNEEWLAEGRAALVRARDIAATSSAADLAGCMLREVCSTYVAIFRRERGFIRAALKHASAHPDSWTPFKSTGRAFTDDVVEALEPLLAQLPPSQRAPRIRFAMQSMFAAGVNSVLNDPGPIRLDDPRLEAELGNMLCAYLELQ